MLKKSRKFVSLTKKYLPSVATFLVGTGSLLIADVLIGKFAYPEDLKNWIILKSLMLPIATLATLGIDQVVVREPSKLNTFILPSLVISIIISLLFSQLLWFFKFYDKPFVLFFAVIGIVVSTILFGVFRATLNFSMAQFSRDGWKLLFLLILIPSYLFYQFEIYYSLLIAIFITTILSVLRYFTMSVRKMNEVHNEVFNFRSALSVSWPFCLNSFALAVASYGELALLSGFGGDNSLPEYFRATILFSMPIITFNTLLATYLGSAIREKPDYFSKIAIKYNRRSNAILFISPILAISFGYALSIFLFPDERISLTVAVLLSISAGLRIKYSIISCFVGVLAKKFEIRKIAIQYFSFAVATPFVCFFINFCIDHLLFSVAMTGVVHWLARNAVGSNMMYRVCQRYSAGENTVRIDV